jgi:hypothetical protein
VWAELAGGDVTPGTYGADMETISRTGAEPQVLPLPFDDGADETVPFVLTAAAHREVLGRPVPALAAVGAATDPPAEEPTDTRRVQARALLRSGMPTSTIAAALGVDVVEVDRWTADLGDELERRRRRATRRPSRPSRASGSTEGVELPGVRAPMSRDERERLLPGLTLALAEVDGDMVTLVHDRVEPVALLLDALREDGVALSSPRIAIRLAPHLPADRIRKEVADRLGVEADTIVVGRSAVGTNRGLELRVDVRDATAALAVRRWCGAAADGADVSGLRGWDSNPQTFRLTADCSAS